ncbi:carbamoyltransferase HypF [Shewanella maritima]|uniref:Carbamoyltransferase HypF n=1 Tax=Shewanella maritima TaxID=2520507 RepID=A0A411PGH9_9GAMM|nr:carbamoyltransferase HypF [Shewanella maritima]QBF82687.1 carbamoyltransferase HypF [Shewanella maritima]
MIKEQVNIFIKGIVQGVGFRPFVFRLADEFNLKGTVLNDHRGVSIVFQGEAALLNQCLVKLEQSPPPLARIDSIDTHYNCIDTEFDSFSIIESDKGDEQAVVALSADKSTCNDCLDEMRDPSNRHYLYPFTNCTNCGPRYSIINALPYDRHNTSMADFDMCAECAKAYKNPMDRRYHAQPVSCPNCGPKLTICELSYDAPSQTTRILNTVSDNIIEQTAKLLEQGKILAIKGLGGFHLVCDATQDKVVNLLRQRKQRPAKPLAVMVKDLTQAKLYATGTDAEWQLLQSAEKPIVVMDKYAPVTNDAQLSDAVAPLLSEAVAPKLSNTIAPGIDRIGLFLPYTPLHHLLMQTFGKPIVATSANRSGEPIICSADDIIDGLGHVVDAIVDHNRPIINACDDSVVQMVDDQLQVIRLARGYAPLTLPTGKVELANKAVLAVGGQQKNAVGFAFKHNLILSPHIGDLFSLEAQSYFDRSLATFKRLYDFKPTELVSDKHPEYAPSQWAQNYHQQTKTPVTKVQHHYGHVLAIMAANQSTQTVLGFSFDGTGLGDDLESGEGSSKCLWGSEVMLANTDSYQILAHFSEFKLIGGEQAIKQPVRILLALLFDVLPLEQIRALPIKAIQALSDNQLNNLYKLWQNPNHGIMCRSVGRLFDAMAVALNLIETNQFEGQAGMLIEAQATQAVLALDNIQSLSQRELASSYIQLESTQYSAVSTAISNEHDQIICWSSQQVFKQVVDALLTASANNDSSDSDDCNDNNELCQQTSASLCLQFINMLAAAVTQVSNEHKQLAHVFCGGVFQNKVLLKQCLQHCQQHQQQVLASQQVPVSDGGLALGQLWHAIHQ